MTEVAPPILSEQSYPEIPYLKLGESVTLTNCDREPIHIPGHAQAYGVVIAMDPKSDGFTILQISANVLTFCRVGPEELLGRGAAALLGLEQLTILKDAISNESLEANPLYLFTGMVGEHGPFHVTAHLHQGILTAELEPLESGASLTETVMPRRDPQALLRYALTRLRSAKTLGTYCQTICETVQAIIGFDRVMVYTFHEDGHGEVIAEVIGEADTREPYLGLHFPESDIPKQARALFILNSVRMMPDASYQPAPIVPALNPLTDRPLDMSYCMLRGYSQMYTEYLINMGARASMSLAIVREGKLWGLIACHHQTARWVPYDVRAACEFLIDVVSLQIADKTTQEDAESREHVLEMHRRLVESMARHGKMLSGLAEDDGGEPGRALLTLVNAAGCAILADHECRVLGDTPSAEEIRALTHWLNAARPESEDVWATDHLADLYPPFVSRKDKAAGLLALRITNATPDGDWVLWFRPEVAQTVNWGGNPSKPYVHGHLGDRLTPRKSFEIWQEAVQGRALPWKAAEVEGARRLKTAITQVIIRHAEELRHLNVELSRSNLELDAFAYVTSHDLKEPLRGINNYIRFLREDNSDSLTPDAQEKLDTVVRLTKRMDNLLDSLLHYSRLGRQDLALVETDMNKVLSDVLETLQPRLLQTGAKVRVPRPLPRSVRCDPVQIGELFTNLITNGMKYNDRPGGERWVEVGWSAVTAVGRGEAESVDRSGLQPPIVFFVRDNGIGIAEKHHLIVFQIFKRLHARGDYEGGSGAGLTICKKIVERHGGRLWLESAVGEGTTFFFTLSPEA